MTISPREATWTEHVRIRAYGFQPDATVDIGFGAPDSASTIIAHTVTDETGTVNVRVAVPGWADPGRPTLRSTDTLSVARIRAADRG